MSVGRLWWIYQHYYKKYKQTENKIPTAICMCSILNCAIRVILGKDCTRPGVLWGSVFHLCWEHLSQLKPTFTGMKCFKQSIVFSKFHFRGKILRSSGVLFLYFPSKIIFLWQVAQCLVNRGTPCCSAEDSKLKPTFQSNHHTFIFRALQFYPNNKLNFTKQVQEISLPSIADAVSPSCPWGEVGAARQGDHGRAVLGLALRAGLQLRLASLAVPTLLPELLLASGWAAGAQLRGRWEAARGTAVGRRGGPCGRQQESCCCWWHSRQCPQEPPWGSQQSMGLRAFWKKGYTLQTDKC